MSEWYSMCPLTKWILWMKFPLFLQHHLPSLSLENQVGQGVLQSRHGNKLKEKMEVQFLSEPRMDMKVHENALEEWKG